MNKTYERQYWAEVCNRLVSDHKLTYLDATCSITNYRSVLKKDGIGDIIYHDSPEYVANGIVRGGYAKRFSSTLVWYAVARMLIVVFVIAIALCFLSKF